jgi:hypothetical protein
LIFPFDLTQKIILELVSTFYGRHWLSVYNDNGVRSQARAQSSRMEGSYYFAWNMDIEMMGYHQEARRDGIFAGLTSGLAGGKCFDIMIHVPCAL